jgi:hypothetical protein
MYKIIGADQKEYGPVSADQLRQWIKEGRVNDQTKVQAADTTDWKAVADCPEFADVLPKAPLPLPPSKSGVPITPLPTQPRNSQMAVWSMITGILSLLCCFCWILVAPVAIVLGAVALSQLKSHPELTGRGFAITGIVLGILAILIYAATSVFFVLHPDFVQNLQNQMQR